MSNENIGSKGWLGGGNAYENNNFGDAYGSIGGQNKKHTSVNSEGAITGSPGSVSSHENAYHRRSREVNREDSAIHFTRWVQFWSIVIFLTSCVVLWGPLWFAHFIGLFAGTCGFHGATHRKKDFVFVFGVLLILETVKNVGCIVLIFKENNIDNNFKKVQIGTLFCVTGLFIPLALRYTFRLHQTLSTFEVGLTIGQGWGSNSETDA